MLILIYHHCLDAVMGAQQLVALLKHNLYQLVVAVLVFSYKDRLHVLLVGVGTDADGAYILSGSGSL